MSAPLQFTPLYIDSQPIDRSTISSDLEDRQISEAETQWLQGAERLSSARQQQEAKIAIRRQVLAIRKQAHQMRMFAPHAQNISTEVNRAIKEFTNSLVTLYGYNAFYERRKLEEEKNSHAFLEKIRATGVELKPFVPKTVAVPSSDSLVGLFQNYQKEKAMEHIVAARVIGGATEAVVNGVGTLLSFTAKSICMANDTNKKVCELALDAGKKTGEKIVEFSKKAIRAIGAERVAKRIFFSQDNALSSQLLRLGISEEQAHQYIHDAHTLTLLAMPYELAAGVLLKKLAFLFKQAHGGQAIPFPAMQETIGKIYQMANKNVSLSKSIDLKPDQSGKFFLKARSDLPESIQVELRQNLSYRILKFDANYLRNIPCIPGSAISSNILKELAQKVNPAVAVDHIVFYKAIDPVVARIGLGMHSVVIKAVQQHEGLCEAFGSRIFSQLNCRELFFSPPFALFQDLRSRIILVKPYAHGETVAALISQSLPIASRAMEQLGKAYSELHTISSRHPNRILLSEFNKKIYFGHDCVIEARHEANKALQGFNQPLIVLDDRTISTFINQWEQMEVYSGFRLGDVGLSNFVYSNKERKLTYVDGQFLANGVNHLGQPIGMLEKDISILVSDIFSVSISNGRSFYDANALVEKFLHHLHQTVHPLPILVGKMESVKSILEGIEIGVSKNGCMQEVERLVAQINRDIELMHY